MFQEASDLSSSFWKGHGVGQDHWACSYDSPRESFRATSSSGIAVKAQARLSGGHHPADLCSEPEAYLLQNQNPPWKKSNKINGIIKHLVGSFCLCVFSIINLCLEKLEVSCSIWDFVYWGIVCMWFEPCSSPSYGEPSTFLPLGIPDKHRLFLLCAMICTDGLPDELQVPTTKYSIYSWQFVSIINSHHPNHNGLRHLKTWIK